jgi:hypothetical protein
MLLGTAVPESLSSKYETDQILFQCWEQMTVDWRRVSLVSKRVLILSYEIMRWVNVFSDWLSRACVCARVRATFPFLFVVSRMQLVFQSLYRTFTRFVAQDLKRQDDLLCEIHNVYASAAL